MNGTRFIILLVALVLVTGCAKPKSESNPLAGWTFRGFDDFEVPADQHHYQLDGAITHDYQDFIAKESLSPRGAITGFFEDGTGQHAIEFEANGNKENSSWHYVLIYDKDNKRAKVIKYGYVRYQS